MVDPIPNVLRLNMRVESLVKHVLWHQVISFGVVKVQLELVYVSQVNQLER